MSHAYKLTYASSLVTPQVYTLCFAGDNTSKKKSPNSPWLGYTWAQCCYMVLVLIQVKSNFIKYHHESEI